MYLNTVFITFLMYFNTMHLYTFKVLYLFSYYLINLRRSLEHN